MFNVKISKSAMMGGLIGFYIIPPVLDAIFQTQNQNVLSPINVIIHSILGLIFIIGLGLFFGIFNDLRDEKIKHLKMMYNYKKMVEEKKNETEKTV